MIDNDETASSIEEQKKQHLSKRVTDHLANERTFLAWIRTGLATITFGFVVERFGLVLRQLGFKNALSDNSVHYSSIFGVSLTLLGVLMMAISLVNFLHIRRAIDAEHFHPPAIFAVILTILACVIGILLAVYLVLTA